MSQKTALVTGGTRGIGEAISRFLAKKGFFVYINSRAENETTKKLADNIRSNGGVCDLLFFDVKDKESIKESIKKFSHSSLDLLVNNAGIVKDNLIPSIKIEDWNNVLDTNIFGAINVFEVYKELLEEGKSVIINMGSIAGVKPRAGQGAYAVSKAMLIEWTANLAIEYGFKKWKFFAISPGAVSTEMIKSAPWYQSGEAFLRIPLKRFASPDELAETVFFLSSYNCPLKSGSNIIIDGGFTLTSNDK